MEQVQDKKAEDSYLNMLLINLSIILPTLFKIWGLYKVGVNVTKIMLYGIRFILVKKFTLIAL